MLVKSPQVSRPFLCDRVRHLQGERGGGRGGGREEGQPGHRQLRGEHDHPGGDLPQAGGGGGGGGRQREEGEGGEKETVEEEEED